MERNHGEQQGINHLYENMKNKKAIKKEVNKLKKANRNNKMFALRRFEQTWERIFEEWSKKKKNM